MNIVLIGSGNVATVLGKLINEAGHNIVQVISRDADHAVQLGSILKASADTDFKEIYKDADIYIIATADDAVKTIVNGLTLGKRIVVHTSGAVSKELLQSAADNYGVLYPLQSLRKEITYTPLIPLLIDANNPKTLHTIELLASSISSKVSVANDEQRLKLHIAAVIAANFSNHLYALTADYCRQEDIPFSMLIPLIQESAKRLDAFAPKDVQTGPAERGDEATIQKHIAMLEAYPQIKDLYKSISKSIMDFGKKT